ncbi:serine/threonine protein kinase [Catenulispora acidiphila DSM 44928]|uniref:non-specific serine/threonine protein kinase n=1 Tax=Catenulispora acidiphila (strain DSM 44928 / JCM 14897 / NBRC 102108 / NRRL B-24433 / ID139908) TaxID=479433 RepID=C7PXG2_CATAD|nr:lanthionine synthetase LanC family protein [Catenulispora acidiphila]ACU71415.1 serine/threonine protein kinase [Catenulispora acidiphila DSM 44928]
MNGGLSPQDVEHLIRKHAAQAGVEIGLKEGTTWLGVRPPGARVMEQGWKLHISSRTGALAETAEVIVPALLAEGCAFKMAGSTDALARLNDGTTTPSSIGKAFTVYPDQDRVRAVGLMLAHLLRGRAAPRVLSDRRVAADAPVYYRYGPIDKPWGADAQGKLVMTLTGPDGEEFPALATLRYRQPTWAVDPFTGEPGARDWERSPNHSTRLGDHYEVDAGIVHAGRGDVMRAVDVRDGSRVIVKQSRALVDEGEDGVDTRLRVRNERRVLAVLEGVDGVAGYVDHFRAGTDEFLVTRDVGRSNLADDVMENGRYPAAAAPEAVPGRTLEQLARQMATIILAVHERGVLIRDLNPRNVVVAPDGSAKLIDLGLAGHNGLYLPGGTSGYSSARQFRHQDATTGDDLLALGTTLCYAWSALPAVVLSRDVDEPRRIALRMIRARCGEAPGGVLGLICDLLSMDDDRVQEAARRMAAGHFSAARRTRTALPASAPVTDALIDEIGANLLSDLTNQTRRILTEVPRTEQVGVDGCVYRGGAGIGLELLEHLETPGVSDLVADLVPFSRRGAEVVRLGPGLWTGRTGLDVFRLTAARRLTPGVVARADPEAKPCDVEILDHDWKPEYSDLISGASGIGLGHLLLRDLDGRPEHLDTARLCAEHVLANTMPDPGSEPGLLGDTSGVEISAARGHGLAGTVDALAVIGTHLADDTILIGADERARELVRRADRLAAQSVRPTTAPLAASWCQGLAGIVTSLLTAGEYLNDSTYTDAARRTADACIALIPRMDKPTQCCGLSGIGNMLIDIAGRDGDERYREAARAVVAQLLVRSAGPAGHPVFVRDHPGEYSASWAYGVAGILSFFRRLSRGGGPMALAVSSSLSCVH